MAVGFGQFAQVKVLTMQTKKGHQDLLKTAICLFKKVYFVKLRHTN